MQSAPIKQVIPGFRIWPVICKESLNPPNAMNGNKPEKPVSKDLPESPPPVALPPDTFGDPDLAMLEEAIEVTEAKTRESNGES
jgi:hypothetical protein